MFRLKKKLPCNAIISIILSKAIYTKIGIKNKPIIWIFDNINFQINYWIITQSINVNKIVIIKYDNIVLLIIFEENSDDGRNDCCFKLVNFILELIIFFLYDFSNRINDKIIIKQEITFDIINPFFNDY